MRTLFGMSIDKILFIAGGIFLFSATVILFVGLVKSHNDKKDPQKTQQELEQFHNSIVITASVLFSVAIVLIGTGLITYFRGDRHTPLPSPSPAVDDDEQMIDAKLKEGWFLKPEDSIHTDPATDPSVINDENLAEWGLHHGSKPSKDADKWVLHKNTKTYKHNPKKSRTVNYRGLCVVLNENVPGIKKKATKSPAFFATE